MGMGVLGYSPYPLGLMAWCLRGFFLSFLGVARW